MLLLLSPRNSSRQAFQFRLLVHSSSVAAQILPERHGGALNGPNSALLSAQTVPTQPWLVFLCSLQVPLPLSSRRCPTIILLAPALLPAGVMSSYRPEPNAHISKHDWGSSSSSGTDFLQCIYNLREVNRTSSPQNTTRDIPEACSLPGARLFIYT